MAKENQIEIFCVQEHHFGNPGVREAQSFWLRKQGYDMLAFVNSGGRGGG